MRRKGSSNLIDLVKEGAFEDCYAAFAREANTSSRGLAPVKDKGDANTLLMHALEIGIAVFLCNSWGSRFESDTKDSLLKLSKLSRKGTFFTAALLDALCIRAASDLPIIYGFNYQRQSARDRKLLTQILERTDWNGFKGTRRCLYQPLITDSANAIKGRPDFVIDDRIVDVKGTIELSSRREHIQQLVGYHQIDERSKNPLGLGSFEIYYSRHQAWKRFSGMQIERHRDAKRFKKLFLKISTEVDEYRAQRIRTILRDIGRISHKNAAQLKKMIEEKASSERDS